MRRRSARSATRRALGSVLVALMILGVAEIAAGRLDLPDPHAPPQSGEGILLRGSPWLLWELVPGRHEELGVTVYIDPDGLRSHGGQTAAEAHDPARLTLALGDSSVYGHGVGDGEVFTSVLQARWKSHVKNAAVPGYSSLQSWNWLQMRGLALEPDLLLVGNLWSDNNFDTFVDHELMADYAAWEGTAAARLGAWAQQSALFRLLDWGIRVRARQDHAAKVGWSLGGTPPAEGPRRVAINLYARHLESFCRRMYQHNGGVVFLMLANREDLEPGPDAAWLPYRDVMRTVAARWGAPLVEVAPRFRASGLSRDSLFLDQMHPTAAGHGLLADAVADALPRWPDEPVRLRAPSGPLPAFTDPLDRGRVPDGLTRLEGDLILPELTGAPGEGPRVKIELRTDGLLRGVSSRLGPGPFVIDVPTVPAEAEVTVSADVAPDGDSPGDRSWLPVRVVPENGRWRVEPQAPAPQATPPR